MHRWRAWIAVIAALVAATACAQPVAADTALAGPALHAALQRGGYVLYFRHTSTDFGQNDDAMTTFDDCSKQRNLTDQGRAEARTAGAAIARLRIPTGGANTVIASHGNPFYGVAGPPQLAEGEAAVIEPLGAGGFRIVARIRKDGWDALAKQ